MKRFRFFSARVEESLSKIRAKYRGHIAKKDVDDSLKEWLFHGMSKGIRDSVRYLYNDHRFSYFKPLVAATKVENEGLEIKTVTAKAGTSSGIQNNGMDDLTQEH